MSGTGRFESLVAPRHSCSYHRNHVAPFSCVPVAPSTVRLSHRHPRTPEYYVVRTRVPCPYTTGWFRSKNGNRSPPNDRTFVIISPLLATFRSVTFNGHYRAFLTVWIVAYTRNYRFPEETFNFLYFSTDELSLGGNYFTKYS